MLIIQAFKKVDCLLCNCFQNNSAVEHFTNKHYDKLDHKLFHYCGYDKQKFETCQYSFVILYHINVIIFSRVQFRSSCTMHCVLIGILCKLLTLNCLESCVNLTGLYCRCKLSQFLLLISSVS